jgi:RNA polymerase sigma-70 factor (ECF subfamily)
MAAIDDLVARARAAWPEIDLPDAVVYGHFSDKLAENDEIVVDDLYLACACAQQNPVAIAAFESRYLSQVKVFLGRMKPPASLVDEVQQALRVRLLVAEPGSVPRIAEYGGRGTLTAWLRVAAIRLAIDAFRRAGNAPPDDEPLEQISGDDPELEIVRDRYRAELNDALREAFAVLTAEQRNLLRLNYRDGRSIDDIAALLSVHRATVARRIAEAREAILDETRRRFETRLGLSPAELQSLIRLLRSQLHLSVSRLLHE